MIVEKTDLVLPGRIPINLSRTYNPFDPYDNIAGVESPFGPGWYLSFDPTLLKLNTNLIRLILPGNARLDLLKQADGSFQNFSHPILSGAALVDTAPGERELRYKDGTTCRCQLP